MLPEDRLREAEKQTRIAAESRADAGFFGDNGKLHALADELEAESEATAEAREDRDDAEAVR